jgi:DNA polymerase delta subunit 3
MLYDFHRKQNSKKPGSVHATYIVSGTKTVTQTSPIQSQSQQNGEDSVMQSSPPLPSSSMQPNDEEATTVVRIHSVMLVKEEDLEQASKQFESISGMHIYSLEPSTVGDIQVLTDCNRRVAADYAGEDPMKEWKQYGVIQNKDVRRRTKGGVPPKIVAAAKPPAAKAAPKATPAAPTAKSVAPITEAKPVEKSAAPSKFDTSKKPAKKNDSSIFSSFAKGTANAKKKAEESQAAAEAEDAAMGGFSDDDDEYAGSGLPEELAEVKEPAGESKSDRKARLEAMMDAEDEEMEDAAATPSVATPADTTDSQHDDGAIDGSAMDTKDEPKETVTVENGRRRGRRRVMKKKTVKDEDGYLGMIFNTNVLVSHSANTSQSPERSRCGKSSPKTSQHRRRQKFRRLRATSL